jgi:hypothetical protein
MEEKTFNQVQQTIYPQSSTVNVDFTFHIRFDLFEHSRPSLKGSSEAEPSRKWAKGSWPFYFCPRVFGAFDPIRPRSCCGTEWVG